MLEHFLKLIKLSNQARINYNYLARSTYDFLKIQTIRYRLS